MKRIHVAVGVIVNPAKKILIAQRPINLHQGGKWEFPGGKVEANESVSQALTRELFEEVNLVVQSTTPLMDISYDYPDKNVFLDIHWVHNFQGLAKGREGQPIKWVTKEQLPNFDFPEANSAIVNHILNTTL